MNRLRAVCSFLLAIIFMVPPGAALAESQVPEKAAITAYVPIAGSWSGTTNLGFPVTFSVNSTGTAWSNFFAATMVTIGTCTASVTDLVGGPGGISSNQFKWTTATFSFTGTFTSSNTATGTYAWTNRLVSSACGNKTFSQSGTWSARAPLSVPGAFSKVTPANTAVNQRVYPRLTWNASPGAASYEYCIDVTNVNPCGGIWKTNAANTSVTVGPLIQNTTYYWQVRARNTTGVTAANAGTWWTFKTGFLPGAFSKTSPANGATSQPLASLLKWTASAGATGYLYCFDTVNDNKCNTKWTWAANVTSIDPPGVFLPGKTYYWQVWAVNAVGSTFANGGSWWPFSTVPPSKLVLLSIGSQDGWIVESTATSGVGGQKDSAGVTFPLGDDKLNRQFRGILSFYTKSLPTGAVLTGVTLRLRQYRISPSNPFATLGNIFGDIKKGTFGTSALELSDFQATPSKPAVLMIPNAPVNGWYAGSMGSGNFTYINRLGFTQFRLRFAKGDNNNLIADYISFYSGNISTAGLRPQLVLLYYVP